MLLLERLIDMGAVARAVAAAAACWALCACGPVGPGLNSPTSSGKGESSVERTPSSDYEGRKPFGERVDVITARSQLMGALARVRSRVDAEFGARQWTWLDEDPNKLYDPCDDLHEGGYLDHSRQGIAPRFLEGCVAAHACHRQGGGRSFRFHGGHRRLRWS